MFVMIQSPQRIGSLAIVIKAGITMKPNVMRADMAKLRLVLQPLVSLFTRQPSWYDRYLTRIWRNTKSDQD